MAESNTPGAIATWKELADWFNETAYDGTLFDVDGNLNVPDWKKWGNEFKSFTARNGYIDGGGGIWIRVSDTSPTTPLAPSSNNPKIYGEYGYTSSIPSWSKGSATSGSVTGTITGGSAKVGQKVMQTTVDNTTGKITTATVGGTIVGTMTLGDLLLGSALGIGLGVKFVDFFPDQATDFSNFCLLPLINAGIIEPATYEETRVGLTNVLREHNDEQGNKLITPYAPYEAIEKGLTYLFKIGAFSDGEPEVIYKTPKINDIVVYEKMTSDRAVEILKFLSEKSLSNFKENSGEDPFPDDINNLIDMSINTVVKAYNDKYGFKDDIMYDFHYSIARSGNASTGEKLPLYSLALAIYSRQYIEGQYVNGSITEYENGGAFPVNDKPNNYGNFAVFYRSYSADLIKQQILTKAITDTTVRNTGSYRYGYRTIYTVQSPVNKQWNSDTWYGTAFTNIKSGQTVNGIKKTDITPIVKSIDDVIKRLNNWREKNGYKITTPSYDENGNPNGVRDQWYLPIPTPTPSTKTSPDYITPSGLYEPTNVPDNDNDLQDEILDRLKDIEDQLPSNPKYKPTPTPPSEDTGEINTPTSILGNNGQGLWSVYNPSLSQINQFGAWLWSNDIWEQIKQFFSDPMQGIIGLHKIFCKPTNGDTKTIIAGYLDSGVSSPTVVRQYERIDCGSLACAEYYGNALDYAPYTDVSIYLPFVGVVNLNVNEVMGSVLHVYYDVDILTGACLATIEVKDSKKVVVSLYQYNGVCSVQVPLTSGNYGSVIASLVTTGAGVVATVASGGALAPVLLTGAVSTLNSGANVKQSGSIGSNVGAMAQKKPYLIISRKMPYMALNYNNFEGFPSNNNVYIGNLAGYVRTKKVYIASNIATQSEKEMIENLLSDGVYI